MNNKSINEFIHYLLNIFRIIISYYYYNFFNPSRITVLRCFHEVILCGLLTRKKLLFTR